MGSRTISELSAQTTLPADVVDAVHEALSAGSPGELGEFLTNIFYAVAAIFFVFGLKMLASPKTARRGNLVAALGMLLAVVITLLNQGVGGYATIIAGAVVGGAVGLVAARKVPMTGMPQMVALFNGSGGLASAVVAMAEFWRQPLPGLLLDTRISIGLSVLIGMVTLTGSVVAFLKLRGGTFAGVRVGNPLTFPLQHPLNLLLILVAVLLGVGVANSPASWEMVLLIILSAALGVLLTAPIGGADMPVVVSLLNSYSGLAACAAGFVLHNTGLIISGSLVGASGLILTNIMCKAMNRSLLNVLAGGFGQDVAAAGATGSAEGRTVRQMDAEEAAMVLEASQRVFIIPGYGMAVAQAQHAVAEMAGLLSARGIEVKYGVHPVAGRMPGHMNVLLAEANVPYEQLADLELNSEMEQCDVALVIGANDVVNPDARNPGSQIHGMPIFDVDKARTVMVCKRSLNPGFAGIQNELFFLPNTVMLFGDAKKMVAGIVSELKER